MKWRSLQESGSYSDLRPLREIFAERKETIAKYVPAEVQAIHRRTVDALKADSFATLALASVTTIPPFELSDHDGKRVSSADLLSKGRLVLCFIRGRWCPFCVGQLEAMNYIAAQITDAGAQLVAISPQTEKQAFFMRDQHKLAFPAASRRAQRTRPPIRARLQSPRRTTKALSQHVHQPSVYQWP